MKKYYLQISLSLVVLAIASPNVSAAKISSNSEVKTKIKPNDRVILPAFGDDEWDKENHGTGSVGTLTIDRVPSFVWNKVPLKPETGAAKISTGSAINSNAYLQVSDLRGTYSGYTIKVSFDSNDKWFFDDGVEISPSSIEFNLEKESPESSAQPTAETIDIPAPTVKSCSLIASQEEDVIIAAKGQGVGTWGVWWKNTNLTLDQSVSRSDRTIKSRAITWGLVDGPN
ncbi:MAG: WxL domain-containing protein [Vagococcus salmoninarum]|uniref:WxL domain-containing protein n=1 Tax=Vagococcus salmoninarum TaxID=2739 RepID=UPI003F9A7BB3